MVRDCALVRDGLDPLHSVVCMCVCVCVCVCACVCMCLFTFVCGQGKGAAKKKEEIEGKVNLGKKDHQGIQTHNLMLVKQLC